MKDIDKTSIDDFNKDLQQRLSLVTNSTNGLMSTDLFKKLNDIQEKAEINQWAFSNIKADSTIVPSFSETDTITFASGTNIQLVADINTKKITINVNGKVSSATASDTATKLVKAVTINGVSFDGSTSINITQVNSKNIATTDQLPTEYITSQGANYAVYNTGKIEQWGKISLTGSWATISFPIAFTNITNIAVILTPVSVSNTYSSSSPASAPAIRNITKTGFDVLLSGGGTTWNATYLAIAK